MSIFWSLIEGLNEVLINSLSCESNTHESADKNLAESLQIDEWYKQLHYSTDNEIDRYLERNGLYYNIEHDESVRVLLEYLTEQKKILKRKSRGLVGIALIHSPICLTEKEVLNKVISYIDDSYAKENIEDRLNRAKKMYLNGNK